MTRFHQCGFTATKPTALLLFLMTGLLGGLSALYFWRRYLGALPPRWWSGPLVFASLAASLGMLLAGAAIFFSPRLSRLAALSSGSVLEAFLFLGMLATGVGALFSARGDWTPFAAFVLVPFMFTTVSLVIAWRSPAAQQ